MFLFVLLASVVSAAPVTSEVTPASHVAPAALFSLSGSVAGLNGGGSGAGVAGRVIYNPSPRLGVEVGTREAVVVPNDRVTGTILVLGRYKFGPAYLAAGFAHSHETPLELAKAQPVAATFGGLEGIEHRSGFEVGAGFDAPLSMIGDRWGVTGALTMTAFPDAVGTPLYANAELGLSFDVGTLTRNRGE